MQRAESRRRQDMESLGLPWTLLRARPETRRVRLVEDRDELSGFRDWGPDSTDDVSYVRARRPVWGFYHSLSGPSGPLTHSSQGAGYPGPDRRFGSPSDPRTPLRVLSRTPTPKCCTPSDDPSTLGHPRGPPWSTPSLGLRTHPRTSSTRAVPPDTEVPPRPDHPRLGHQPHPLRRSPSPHLPSSSVVSDSASGGEGVRTHL